MSVGDPSSFVPLPPQCWNPPSPGAHRASMKATGWGGGGCWALGEADELSEDHRFELWVGKPQHVLGRSISVHTRLQQWIPSCISDYLWHIQNSTHFPWRCSEVQSTWEDKGWMFLKGFLSMKWVLISPVNTVWSHQWCETKKKTALTLIWWVCTICFVSGLP